MTTSTRSATSRTNTDGHEGVGRFGLAAPKRPTQMPQLVVALTVILVSALIAVVVFSQVSAREPVVALSSDLSRGQVVSAGDVQAVLVASDDPVTLVPAADVGSLVGKVAVTDLVAGSLASPGFFVDRAVVAPGEGVVGLALAPGEYPTVQLAPGDLVDVVATESGVVVVSGAEVFDISELGTQGGRFVSLRTDAAAAAEVAAMPGGVRLVLVAGGES